MVDLIIAGWLIAAILACLAWWALRRNEPMDDQEAWGDVTGYGRDDR